jgi:hypothetical protein
MFSAQQVSLRTTKAVFTALISKEGTYNQKPDMPSRTIFKKSNFLYCCVFYDSLFRFSVRLFLVTAALQ